MSGPEDLVGRSADLDQDGVDLAVVAPSTALGTEWLPREEAEPLLAAQRAGVLAAGRRFRRWGQISLVEPDPADVDRELASGAAGLCISAGALSGVQELERIGPVLEQLARAGAPLFIHPGPTRWDLARADHGRWSPEPWWWPGLTDYVAGMQRAWLVWAARGRRDHPRLNVLFAMMAGLAPLQAERLAARGAAQVAERAVCDDRTWYETSSYGPVAHAAVTQVVGAGRLVHGSDRPVIAGALPVAVTPAHAAQNAHALFGGTALFEDPARELAAQAHLVHPQSGAIASEKAA